MSLVSVLPAVDVFLLHPPVVVNGGTHVAMTTAAASIKQCDAANGPRKATSGAELATPDLIDTPEVMSPEATDGGSDVNVEGKANGNFTGKIYVRSCFCEALLC